MARHIFIGDIHGCYDELVELLGIVSPMEKDKVISVGDFVRKGPEVENCLDLWITRGYLAVLGNNEEKMLNSSLASSRLSPRHRRYLKTLPLFLDFPEIEVAVVHGGLLPHMRVERTEIERNRYRVLRLRHVREENGEWTAVAKGDQRAGDRWWAEVWDGERTIVYGHSSTPDHQPRIHKKAIGLDTGCVYGGRLTAAIYDGGWDFASVPAKHAYAERLGLSSAGP